MHDLEALVIWFLMLYFMTSDACVFWAFAKFCCFCSHYSVVVSSNLQLQYDSWQLVPWEFSDIKYLVDEHWKHFVR